MDAVISGVPPSRPDSFQSPTEHRLVRPPLGSPRVEIIDEDNHRAAMWFEPAFAIHEHQPRPTRQTCASSGVMAVKLDPPSRMESLAASCSLRIFRPHRSRTAAGNAPRESRSAKCWVQPSRYPFSRRISDALNGLEASGADRLGESLVVALVLVGVALREVGDRAIELVALAEVRGQRHRVS